MTRTMTNTQGKTKYFWVVRTRLVDHASEQGVISLIGNVNIEKGRSGTQIFYNVEPNYDIVFTFEVKQFNFKIWHP